MPLFAVSAFLAAFLLFQVQLVIGKAILPWFGGTPAVWTTCLLFFQVGLLGGYAWAHVAISGPHPRRWRFVHLALLVVAVAALAWHALAWRSPILPAASWRPAGNSAPVPYILALLAVGVGVPYLVLSATAPMLQAWFSRVFPGRSPYPLYALSNLGSLMALLSYPFLVEPLLPLRTQAWIWGLGFVVFAGTFGACAVRVGKAPEGAAPVPHQERPAAPDPVPGIGQRLLWLALPAGASILLLAVTNQICQEVAVVPFLWVLPLSLYLLSFVVCFHRRRWYGRGVFHPLLVATAFVACLLLYHGVDVPVPLQIGAWSFVLFCCCMVCHGELARRAPSPAHLTSFYLLIALGGAVGGVFVGIAAPVLFLGYWELHIGLAACGLLALLALLEDHGSWLRAGKVWPAVAALLAAIAGSAYLVLPGLQGPALVRLWPQAVAAAGVLVAVVWLGRRARSQSRSLLATACIAVALMLLSVVLRAHMRAVEAGSLAMSRGFFGVLKVEQEHEGDPDRHTFSLRHGRILHGFQYASEAKRRIPTSYYGEGSGISLALLHHPRRTATAPAGGNLRIGVAGLGVGTIAAYGREGDLLRFYEINPDVVRLAMGDGPFTYLEDTPASVEVVLGDARVSLEREESQQFDVLAVDAFSSGAIPVHLLTREAFQVYLRHLRPDGVLAIDVSNRGLDLTPVVWSLAHHFGLAAVQVAKKGADDGSSWGSLWILLTRSSAFLSAPGVADPEARWENGSRTFPVWSDDATSLLPLIKKK